MEVSTFVVAGRQLHILLKALMVRSFCGELVLNDFVLSEGIRLPYALCTHWEGISVFSVDGRISTSLPELVPRSGHCE